MSNAINPKRSNSSHTERHLQSLIYLCDSLAVIRTPVESAMVLKDIFSPQEMITIANRLQIAAMLLEGCEYEEIRHILGVSISTISRISTWLEKNGDGYRLLTDRVTLTSHARINKADFHSPTKIGSQYIWPAVLISSLLETVDKSSAYKILEILAEAKQKPELYRILKATDAG